MEELIPNPFAAFEDKADPLIPTATKMIYDQISEYLMEVKDGTNVNRASSASMCIRRRWYQRNGYKSDPLTPRKIVNFMLGDLSERTLLYFIQTGCVGGGKIYSEVRFGDTLGKIQFQGKDLGLYKQHTWSFKLGDQTITGHADGMGRRNSDGKWELIEIKSAADYGFKEFQENGPGDYLKQSHTLMLTDEAKAKDIKSVRFFYLRKSTGHVWDRLFHYDETLAQKVIEEFKVVMEKEAPPAPYEIMPVVVRGKETGEWTIPWQCQYCGYRETCKPGAKMEWKKDQFGQMKPVYRYTKGDSKWSSQENKRQKEAVTF